MFIEKFALKNNNAQYQYICAAVFLRKNHLNACSYRSKNLQICNYKSVITHARMYVAKLVFWIDGKYFVKRY